ncbi:hypothetical protein EDD16DRAFT_1522208 [Pisolithus croceorrhizus]|nr:hypothetical protein EDD16DRAFT_1522208 [Pisolithus croceorrhizus]KAI6111900.1 hypothetical protein EV401DRAFT_1890623 [Pisolithus croceorrhizus]KAI6163943.1 hypothetical protein EDD17DRAFT_1807970 [Pisolithus thermaeus]
MFLDTLWAVLVVVDPNPYHSGTRSPPPILFMSGEASETNRDRKVLIFCQLANLGTDSAPDVIEQGAKDSANGLVGDSITRKNGGGTVFIREVDRDLPKGVGASISPSMHAEVSQENAVQHGTDKGKMCRHNFSNEEGHLVNGNDDDQQPLRIISDTQQTMTMSLSMMCCTVDHATPGLNHPPFPSTTVPEWPTLHFDHEKIAS